MERDVASPPTPSEAQCWDRGDPAVSVLTGISLVAAALLSGLKHPNFHSLLIVAGFSSVLISRKTPVPSGGRAKGDRRTQSTNSTSRNRPVVGKHQQQDEEILICTKISMSCLHTPSHAMITKTHSCVKCLQHESFMAALSCTEHRRHRSLLGKKISLHSLLDFLNICCDCCTN